MITKTAQKLQYFVDNKSRRFFEKRVTKADKVKLSLNNVYIFFSQEGILFGLLLLITFVTGVNYSNNLILGLSFYLGSIWLISLHLTFSHVVRLEFKLLDVSMPEAEKPAWVTIEINNPSSKPSRQLSLQFDHSEYLQQHGLTKQDLPKALITKRAESVDNQSVVRLPVMTSKRGVMTLPRLLVSTVYPLGIMRAWAYVYFATPIWVYPKPLEFEWNSNNKSATEDTEFSHHQVKGQNDFDRLKEYQDGESLARVSWQHFARGHGMLTKHFCDAVGHEMTLSYQDMPAINHEQKLQQLAFVVHTASKANESFSLSLPNDRGEFGQGQAFVNSCLLRLAKAP